MLLANSNSKAALCSTRTFDGQALPNYFFSAGRMRPCHRSQTWPFIALDATQTPRAFAL